MQHISANEGHLYPLEKQFIFIHKPAVLIRFDEIESVEFQRYAGGQGSTRNFDLCVTLHNTPGDSLSAKEYTFSGIDKTNYTALYSFLSGKKIRIMNIEGVGGVAEEQPLARGAAMYNEMEGGEEMGESSEDDDYDGANPGGSEESSSDSEGDDDLGSVASDDSDLAEHRGKSSAVPKKRSKEDKKPKANKIPKKKSSSSDADSESKKSSTKKRKKESSSPVPKKAAASPKKKKAKKDPNAPKKARSGKS